MIRVTDGKLTVDHVSEGLNDAHDQAQLRQVVTSHYGVTQADSELTDNVFEDADCGEGKTFEENRVAWIKVPKGTTKEQVEQMLDNYPTGRIYKILSNQPVLTTEQKNAMEQKLNSKTLKDYQESQQVVDADGNPVFYDGKAQYRVTFFSKAGKSDEDRRSGVAEMASAKADVQEAVVA